MPEMLFEKEIIEAGLRSSQINSSARFLKTNTLLHSRKKLICCSLSHLVSDAYVLTPITQITMTNVRLRTKTQSYNIHHLAAFDAQMVLSKPYKSGFSASRG